MLIIQLFIGFLLFLLWICILSSGTSLFFIGCYLLIYFNKNAFKLRNIFVLLLLGLLLIILHFIIAHLIIKFFGETREPIFPFLLIMSLVIIIGTIASIIHKIKHRKKGIGNFFAEDVYVSNAFQGADQTPENKEQVEEKEQNLNDMCNCPTYFHSIDQTPENKKQGEEKEQNLDDRSCL